LAVTNKRSLSPIDRDIVCRRTVGRATNRGERDNRQR